MTSTVFVLTDMPKFKAGRVQFRVRGERVTYELVPRSYFFLSGISTRIIHLCCYNLHSNVSTSITRLNFTLLYGFHVNLATIMNPFADRQRIVSLCDERVHLDTNKHTVVFCLSQCMTLIEHF